MDKLKCINISAREAARLGGLPKNWAMISINEEHQQEYPLQFSGEKLIRVRFSDVTHKIEHKGQVYDSIKHESALKIVDFIDKYKDHNFICHCQAGVSRSGAVCMFLHLIHGHELKSDYFLTSYPNPYILGMLMVEHATNKLS